MGLDTVEIVMCWEESLGISVPDRDAEHLVTPAMAVEYLAGLVGAKDDRSFPCLGQRAFHRVRKCLTRINGIQRERISPDVHLRDLLPDKGSRASWKQFAHDLGLGDLVQTLGLPLLGAGSTRIKDIVTQTVARRAQVLVGPHERWSRQQLRAIVRTSVDYVAGKRDFSDEDKFVGDIGLD
jgi:hypothetical protein